MEKCTIKQLNNLFETIGMSITDAPTKKYGEYVIKQNDVETAFAWKASKADLFMALQAVINSDTLEDKSVNNVITMIKNNKQTPATAKNNIVATTKVSAPVKEKRLSLSKEREELVGDDHSYPLLPKVIEGFYMPDFADSLVARVRYKRNVLLTGPTGSGKSDLIEKMAKAYEIPCVRINFSSGTSEGDLLGKFVIKNSETVFADGYIPLAMKNGWWVILDEVDYAQPEHISCLQAVLEGKSLVNIKNEGEIVDPHARFRVFATANTKGRGDMTDSYNGTNFLNIAFLDRWTIFEMNYTKKEKEIAKTIIGDDVMAGKLIDLFNLLRQSVKNNDLNNASFSTRRLIQTCEALKMGDTLSDAIQYEILNRYHEEEVNIISEYINDVFDNTFYIKGNWRLGMDHFKPQQAVDTNVQTDNSMKYII